jgi:putative transposase
MVTTSTWARREVFRNPQWAKLLIDTLYHYRSSAYLLHEFVIMPDHIHALITPLTSLEKSVQFIKGGFSHRVKKELGSNMEVWQKGFSDHRIRDADDYKFHATYMHESPVKKNLCERAEKYLYSSAHASFELDEVPQGLKPISFAKTVGTPEGAPFQSQEVRSDSQDFPANQDFAANEERQSDLGEGSALQDKETAKVTAACNSVNKIA